jgi:hypothetical protein
MKTLNKDLQITMPVIFFLGGLSTLTTYFFILNVRRDTWQFQFVHFVFQNFFASTYILKIRIIFILLINISMSVMFAKSGQGIVDEVYDNNFPNYDDGIRFCRPTEFSTSLLFVRGTIGI